MPGAFVSYECHFRGTILDELFQSESYGSSKSLVTPWGTPANFWPLRNSQLATPTPEREALFVCLAGHGRIDGGLPTSHSPLDPGTLSRQSGPHVSDLGTPV